MRVQLIVTYLDEHIRYHTVGMGKPWKFASMNGIDFLVIGNGMGRQYIPMQNVRSVELGEFASDE